jgi:periplasmic protein TonB
MPGDLFRTVAVRPPSVQSRRSPIFVLSLAVHIIVLVTVLIGSALAPGVLPSPREVLAFYEPIRLDIKLPPPPPAPRPPTANPTSAPSVSADAAPLVPPSEIAPESPLETLVSPPAGVVVGVSNDIGSDVGVIAAALPPPVVTPRPPVRVGGNIIPPVKTHNVSPVYPDLARQTKTQGVVILEAVIDESGIVTSARVLRGKPLLDQAAVDAVSQWKFTPARLNNEAIPVVITVTVNFTLN